MKRRKMTYLFTIIIFLNACSSDTPPVDMTSGQVVYTNAKIYTVDESNPWADAMIVKDGVITHIGNTTDIDTQTDENATIIDLGGKFVMPGIHDVHMHPLEASSSNFDFVISDEILDAEEYYDDIKAASDTKPGNDWLLGWDIIFIQYWRQKGILKKY